MIKDEFDPPPSPWLPDYGIVRGPFEDWRHGKYQALPSTHEMIDWLRRMANLIEHEYVRGVDIRAPIEDVIVGLNEWDALKHDDDSVRNVGYHVQQQFDPEVWESFAILPTAEQAKKRASKTPGSRCVCVTTHCRFVTEGCE